MRALSAFLLLLSVGCASYSPVYYVPPGSPTAYTELSPGTGQPPADTPYSDPSQPPPTYDPASPGNTPQPYNVYSDASRTGLYPGGRFGYAGIFLGVAGMPGRNDIRPGLSWTIVVPPGGVFITAVSSALLVGGILFDACAYAGGYTGDPIGTYMAVGGMSEILPFTEGMCYQGQNLAPHSEIPQLEAVSFDLYLTGSQNRDLTYSADVLTYGFGLDAAFIAGLGQGGRARLLLGYEYRRIDFKARPDADNHGPMVGAGLEFGTGSNVAFSTQFRYVFTFGSAADYDLWDVSFGTAIYW